MKKLFSFILLSGIAIQTFAAVNPSLLSEFQLAQATGDSDVHALKPCEKKIWGRCSFGKITSCWKRLNGSTICRADGV